MGPLFSIIHPTARPDQWRAIKDAWLGAAIQPQSVEYVIVMDERWGFGPRVPAGSPAVNASEPDVVTVWNEGRRCYVDSVNAGAAAATGDILIVVADDQYPLKGWDRALLVDLRRRESGSNDQFPMLLAAAGLYARTEEFVIEVDTGTTDEHKRGIFVMPIVSRKRYERLGYLFWPEYESAFADNDLCEHARLDGVVLDAREAGQFPHRHPLMYKAVPLDEVYRAQNRQQAYALGAAVLRRRRAAAFGNDVDGQVARRSFALCLTGENFRGAWVDGVLALYHGLAVERGHDVIKVRNYTTNVYVTRAEIWEALREMAYRPDFLVWIDDDNVATPEQLDLLVAVLDARADLDVAAGWCWSHNETQTAFQVSAGNWAPDGVHWVPADATEFPKLRGIQEKEVTGFPFLVMRSSLVDRLGEWPFIRGILDRRLPYGIGGEDLAFCRACREAGVKIGVHPEVRVRHLKHMEVIPEFTLPRIDEPVNLAVMMRVRNEARWIGRVIRSVASLGPVFVLDDYSTDRTADEANAAGAVVIANPHSREDLDEARDKNWFLDQVVERTGCNWVLFIDGDEELERGGAEKVLRACRSGMADAFSVKFLYCWNAPDLVRVDRWYSTFSRLSVFRVMAGNRFRSLYADKGVNVHSGLHTGNAPLPDGAGAPRVAALNVYFLHYGYMLAADRVRKYNYYRSIDPDNPLEDGYRHIAQGDVPEIPAGAVLMHAGPLDVRKLPASIAPDWPEWETDIAVRADEVVAC